MANNSLHFTLIAIEVSNVASDLVVIARSWLAIQQILKIGIVDTSGAMTNLEALQTRRTPARPARVVPAVLGRRADAEVEN